MKISEIVVRERHRKDLGDLDSLMRSMESERGLIQPIVVNGRAELIAGARRLEAAKRLGWKEIDAKIVKGFNDRVQALHAEREENTCREPFKPSELASIAADLLKEEKPAAIGRQHDPRPSEKFSEGQTGEAKEKVAQALGTSRPTLEKIETIVAAAKADPLHYGHLPKKMDAKGKIDPIFKEAQQLAEKHPLPAVPKLIPRSRSAGERFHKTLADIHREFIAIRENHGIGELTVCWSEEERIEYAKQLRLIAADAAEWAGILEKQTCRNNHRKTA